jgi:hypothetical protein
MRSSAAAVTPLLVPALKAEDVRGSARQHHPSTWSVGEVDGGTSEELTEPERSAFRIPPA